MTSIQRQQQQQQLVRFIVLCCLTWKIQFSWVTFTTAFVIQRNHGIHRNKYYNSNRCPVFGVMNHPVLSTNHGWFLQSSTSFRKARQEENEDDFDDEDDDDDDDDDDDAIDIESLGNWRDFRRSLGQSFASGDAAATTTTTTTTPTVAPVSVSIENEALLAMQNEELAHEYRTGVWAHETSVPELGGLMVRMPLEVELYRNYKHSILGQQFRNSLSDSGMISEEEVQQQQQPAQNTTLIWRKAQSLIQSQMLQLAKTATPGGELDATKLSRKHAELLQMYLDQQETWQEVCLIYEKHDTGSVLTSTTSKTTTRSINTQGHQKQKNPTSRMVVLNRPMAMKLTEKLAQWILFGGEQSDDDDDDDDDDNDNYKKKKTASSEQEASQLVRFLLAFGSECGVYIGGPDQQDQPALLLHGFSELPGATEIAHGLYTGGLEAAIDGVLRGKYRALDFRFFVGHHECEGPVSLELLVELGKYQPIAAARSLALKQCLSLPKPLWHEVLELCGGPWKEMSHWERTKDDTIQFHIMEDGDDDDGEEYDEDWDIEDVIRDELDELEFDDDDDEFEWL